MRAVRGIFIAIAVLGGIMVSASACVSLKPRELDFAHAVLIALTGVIGAIPGLMLLGLVTPRSMDWAAISRADRVHNGSD
jgi:hypothetical protein